MPSNSLFDTLNPSGSMGVGEARSTDNNAHLYSAGAGKYPVDNHQQKSQIKNTKQDKIDVECILANVNNKHKYISDKARKRNWLQQEADVRGAARSNYISKNLGNSSARTRLQLEDLNLYKNPGYSSKNAIQQDKQSPLLGIVILCSIIGLVGISGLVGSNTKKTGVTNSSSYSQNASSYSTIPYGKARFRPGSTGETELIGVNISRRENANGHIVYDASWTDGVDSKYVFWKNGSVEIFVKNSQGQYIRSLGSFSEDANSNTVVFASNNTTTTFSQLRPVLN